MRRNEDFQYKSVKDNPAVLGTLEGPCADIVEGTRNGRKYSEELWEKAFSNEIVKEQFSAGGLLGELNHPVDREETDLEKVAVCMPEPPTKKNGKLWAKFHILDTPCGRILKTLCDYGYKIGISSRGTGDVYDDVDGEKVDPDTYQLNAFDAVIIPAVKEARLEMVTESLNPKKSLRMALTESLEKASDKDKKIMEEVLEDLDIEVDSNGANHLDIEYKEEPNEVVTDKSEEEETEENPLVAELKESLLNCQKLEKDNLSLQEQLSVCNAKEKSLEEELARYKKAITSLSDKAKEIKPLKEKVESILAESLEKDEIIDTNNRKLQLAMQHRDKLKEQLSSVRDANKDLQAKVNSLTEQLNTHKSKLSDSVKLVNRYKTELTEAKQELIDTKATAYGISKKELTQRLGESYKVKEIDSICEDLRTYKSQVSKLPFRVSSDTKVSIKPSKEYISGKSTTFDDDISSLLQLLQ